MTTDSADIRASRKMALELLLSDHAGDCVAPCQARCPAGLDIAGFVYELASGNPRRSLEVILDSLVLPGSLGRICPRLCEQGCRRCDLDEGLAIAGLHRYPVDLEQKKSEPFVPGRAASTGKRVAVIGAGPAGLAAAFYLQIKGHDCTIYDAQDEPGGMLRYGIPAYRLPREALEFEIEMIEKLGVHFQMNTRWGEDFCLEDLREEYDSVFIAIGAWKSQRLRCEGDELALSGIDLLEQVAKGEKPYLGDKVIVVGGGNTAMDAARTAIRLGTRRVRTFYRRTRQEMPCLMEEVEAAELEGVSIDYLLAPVKLQRDGDQLLLTCQRMELGEPDSSGRRRPVPIPDSDFQVECTAVVAAIGQSVEVSLAREQNIEVSAWGIASDLKTLETNIPGVFAGGDAVLGADLAIRAVAAGRVAATSIDQFLKGKPVVGLEEQAAVEMRAVSERERAEIFRRIELSSRPQLNLIESSRRLTSFDEIDLGLTDAQVSHEARRCMTCGCRKAGNCIMRQYATEYQADPYRFAGERRQFSQDTSHPEVIYEPGKCIMCDACVRIAAAAGEGLGVTTIGRGFQVAMGVPFDGPLAEGLTKAALRAVEACPTGALALRTGRSCDLGECASCPGASNEAST
ncbi:MAG: FAD-dependent oxidoreductase [Acidobacteriota bacterium]|nr:MAG: FAD-dependent oxidoreductase [Acidobacteriota bacterium]